MKLPKQIQHFITAKIQFNEIYALPHFYPIESEFVTFQNGYRYNPLSKKSLIGTKNGDWQASWYVICSNYFNDPFIIDITETENNFPVYTANHGTGKWQLVQICDTILAFQSTLKELKKQETNPKKSIELLQNKKHLSFWLEIIEELTELT